MNQNFFIEFLIINIFILELFGNIYMYNINKLKYKYK